MRRLALTVLACASCFVLLSAPFRATAQPEDLNESRAESRPAIHVIRLAHAAASEVNDQIGEVADIQGVELTIDHRTNSIILSGDADGIQAIQALCEVIDSAPEMIDVEIAIYELRGEAALQREITPESLQSPDDVRMIRRIRLQSLENQMTTIQLGEVVPVKTGETFGRGGGPAQATYQMENLGTMVTYNARVSGELITMELSIETSRLRTPHETVGESEIAGKTTGVLQSTVSVLPGEPTVVGDFTSLDAPADTRFVVQVTAEVR